MNSSEPRRVGGLRALWALNFFMADAQAGIGPFLGVFLQARGWATGAIGSVLTIGGVAGMLATVPAGAFVDATRHKRALVVWSCVFTVIASAMLWLSPAYGLVVASQIATALAGAAIGPALAGITLGMVGQADFGRRFGRNQVANHAGNVLGAALSGYLGWKFGFGAVFVLGAAFAVVAIVSVLAIPGSSIDDRIARGLDRAGGQVDRHSGFRVLLTSRPLLILAAALAMFHLGNAAIVPLYGLAIVASNQGNPAVFTAETIVIAQLVMVVASLAAIRLIHTRGHWLTILLTFMVLPIRGLIAAFVIKNWGVWPVQILDGVGAGLQGVAVPALVARLMYGTGRVNVGQGAVMTVQGIGASLSPMLGGEIAQAFGYRTAFLALGFLSLGALALWLGYARTVRSACRALPVTLRTVALASPSSKNAPPLTTL